VRTASRLAAVTAVPADDTAPVVLETRSDLLDAAMSEPFGRDHICIGYGGLVRVSSAEAVRANLHERLLDLIAPMPSWRERLIHNPLRCAMFLLRDPGARLPVKQKLSATARMPSSVYALEAWT
jgi:hypothetical protein